MAGKNSVRAGPALFPEQAALAVATRAGRPMIMPSPPDRPSPSRAGVPAELIRGPCYLELLVPARDEARRLPHTLIRVIRYLEGQPYQASVVVVDNGSVDRTVDLVKAMHSPRVLLQVIGTAQPGKGAAVRWGILTSSARFVGYLDADLATPIETLDLVMPLLEAGCRAVAGSRRVGGAALAEREPGQRLLGGILFKAITRRVLPAVADSQCGFKVFDGDVARAAAARLEVDGFAFDVELLRSLAESGVRVTEVPVVWSHQPGSTLHALRDGVRAAADVVRLAHRRGY
jgi:dolichyl-phosphate beta-glucosyltransferase